VRITKEKDGDLNKVESSVRKKRSKKKGQVNSCALVAREKKEMKKRPQFDAKGKRGVRVKNFAWGE